MSPTAPDLSDVGRLLTECMAKDGRVTIPDFGTLTARLRAASIGRTPTGRRVPIPAQAAVDFAPARALKTALAKTVGAKTVGAKTIGAKTIGAKTVGANTQAPTAGSAEPRGSTRKETSRG